MHYEPTPRKKYNTDTVHKPTPRKKYQISAKAHTQTHHQQSPQTEYYHHHLKKKKEDEPIGKYQIKHSNQT